jgi:SAM-dependent methyltransferase
MVRMDEKIARRFTNVSASKTFNNILSHFTLTQKKVLDIGCSYGEFLVHFGPGSVGVSIEQEEVDYGTRKGIDIRYGNIESEEFVLKEQFDVIFANNIFEHLYSPHHFLCAIKKYLKPGGTLILGVPCVPKVVSLLPISKFHGALASGHINFFTKETLRFTAERAGWDVSEVRGFHFALPFIDHLLDPIYPHFYVSAKNDPAFVYPEKRLRELVGYGLSDKK